MAEPATQFPYISSSAGGGSSESGGRDAKGAGAPRSCAEGTTPHPLTEQALSEVVSPPSPGGFSLADAQASHLTYAENQRKMSGKPTPFHAEEFKDGKRWSRFSGTSEDSGIEAASAGSPGPEEPLFSVGSKAHNNGAAGSIGPGNSMGEVNVDSKSDLNNYDQYFLDQPKQPASRGESKFTMPANLQEEPEQLLARATHSVSSSCPAAPGDAVVDKDSPESPFEVIADKLEFDKEFRDVVTSNSGDLSGNWVMHSERELLTDIPEDSVCEFRAKPRGGGRVPSGPGLSRQSSGTTAALEEVSKCVREMHNFTSEMMNWDLIPKDLGEKTDDSVSPDHPVSPPNKVGGVIAGSAGSKAEADKTSAPYQPLKISAHQKSRMPSDVEKQPAQKRMNGEAAVVKTEAAAEAKPDVRWPNQGVPETADGDSSGESDDTVIEDTVAGPAFRDERARESGVQPQKPASAPAVSAKKENMIIGSKDRSGEPRKPIQEVGVPSKSPEGNWGFIDEFETAQAKADVLRESPVSPSPGGTSALDSVKEAVCPDALNGESFVDFMKECLKSKGNESPQDPVETFSEAELKAARSEVLAPHFQQPPKATQDFEQEHLTIKALKEVGRKTQAEKQSPGPSKVSLPGGRQPGQYGERLPEPPVRSALEKRPLCLEQAVDVRLSSASASFGMPSVPSAPSQAPPREVPVPHAIAKLLTEVSVHDLIFWRDVKKTGLVFSSTLILLLSLAAFSVISVISYLILALLSVTISFRVYKSVIQAVQKSEEGHPFKAYLDVDITLSSETFHNYMSSAMVHINRALKAIMRLFLVEDLVDSLKLAAVMWLMTYIGAVFNGITLLILVELLVFSLPVVYEKYKTQIDHYVGIGRDQIKSVVTKIQAKVPGAVKKKAE